MKIVAFHFAGGNRYSFQKFSKNLSDFVVIEYPGRGMEFKEKLLSDINLLVENLISKVKEEINLCDDYMIYGHSMGALVGYLICRRIQELGLKRPLRLIVSGRKSPSVKRKIILSHLPDNMFWEEVIKLGGIADELQNHSELMEFYVPILKADFKAIENYDHIKTEKLNLPIDVFYGRDEDIEENEVMEWKNESTGNVSITILEGNHFFIFNNEDFFINYFNNLKKNQIYQQTNA